MTVTGTLNITAPSSSGSDAILLTLPVASTYGAASDVTGVVQNMKTGFPRNPIGAECEANNNSGAMRIALLVNNEGTGAAQKVSYCVQYEIK